MSFSWYPREREMCFRSRSIQTRMLSKRGYIIHFARLSFATLVYALSSCLSILWSAYQPWHLTLESQRCHATESARITTVRTWLNELRWTDLLPTVSILSSSRPSICHVLIHEDHHLLNIDRCIELCRSTLVIYFVYHLLRLSLFHAHVKRAEAKRCAYARLYRQARIVRQP
jgi:hypothetical protein